MSLRSVSFTIFGEAASKANSRRLVTGRNGRLVSIKSAKALALFHSAALQIPPCVPLEMPVRVVMRLFYASGRPDLDESVLLDAMQSTFIGSGKAKRMVRAGAYINDRQVKEKHIYSFIDRRNPRAEITVEEIEWQAEADPAIPSSDSLSSAMSMKRRP